MCGRAAQSGAVVQAAANELGVSRFQDPRTASHPDLSTDNYNMSPGMDALVFWNDATSSRIQVDRKVWGLVPRHGTVNHPLPKGMGLHFSNLMFNARADTLYDKPTFAKLVKEGKTCVVALDGFFEWKSELKGKKQPYFVYRKGGPCLLMAGLWTSVPTGRAKDPTLDTFTIITTDACPSLQWLHTRMPVCIWDEKAAVQWLLHPSRKLHERLDEEARKAPEGLLDWHAVTPDMSNMKYRSKDAMKSLPKVKTLDSFFGPKKGDSPSVKRKSTSTPSTTASASPEKKPRTSSTPKKGSITSFFSPKKKS